MEAISIINYPSGRTLYAFPTSQSLADWLIHRVLLTEGTGADAGRYTGWADTDIGTEFVMFEGTPQPSSWAEAIRGVTWNLNATIAAQQSTSAASTSFVASLEAKRARQWNVNKRTVQVLGENQWRYTVYEDDQITPGYRVDYDPETGNKSVV